MSSETLSDWCECGHMDVHHDERRCRSKDSYGFDCECDKFVPVNDPDDSEDAELDEDTLHSERFVDEQLWRNYPFPQVDQHPEP